MLRLSTWRRQSNEMPKGLVHFTGYCRRYCWAVLACCHLRRSASLRSHHRAVTPCTRPNPAPMVGSLDDTEKDPICPHTLPSKSIPQAVSRVVSCEDCNSCSRMAVWAVRRTNQFVATALPNPEPWILRVPGVFRLSMDPHTKLSHACRVHCSRGRRRHAASWFGSFTASIIGRGLARCVYFLFLRPTSVTRLPTVSQRSQRPHMDCTVFGSRRQTSDYRERSHVRIYAFKVCSIAGVLHSCVHCTSPYTGMPHSKEYHISMRTRIECI
jgi:hypothetical protein